jgi:glycosyltransferase involved in cell wall biosynthesis
LYNNNRIAIVVPAYNEELLLGPTLDSIPDFVDRIYVINDASKDRTQEVADQHAAKDSRILPIQHEKNKGVGAAIITGYRKAIEDQVDIAAVMAGDNQMDPAFLPHLLDPIINGKADYTVGNRLVNPDYRKGMSRWRFFGNALLTLFTKIASGYWQMIDPQNGYTAISRRALERIGLDEVYPGYGYCNDLLVRLNTWGFRMVNVAHPARYGQERSGIKYGRYIFRVCTLLLRDFLWRMKTKYIILSFHPLVLFYLFGVILEIIGFVLGVYALYFKFVQDYPIFVPAASAVIVFGLGAQFVLFAMLFDMEQDRNICGGWYD